MSAGGEVDAVKEQKVKDAAAQKTRGQVSASVIFSVIFPG